MSKAVIFAGTSEGRKLAEVLQAHGRPFHLCVATEYGEEVLKEEMADEVTVGRLDSDGMKELIGREEADCVVDATHPYAVIVSRNIRRACEEKQVPYLRLVRDSEEESVRGDRDVVCVDSVAEAAEFLKHTSGRALVTTGSKELEEYTRVENYTERLTVRVLPSEEAVGACRRLGFSGGNIIAMQGPFSEEMNAAMLKQTQASYLVTKESGKPGGFSEKGQAAKKAGARLILVRRPAHEKGYSLEEIVKKLCPEGLGDVKELDFISTEPRRITLLGIGMGSLGQLTLDGYQACREADLFIGARRMLRTLEPFDKPVYESCKSDEILRYIHEHPEYHRVVVALSGDVGFYSGAKKLLAGMEEEKVDLISGISSVMYFCSRLHTSWEDVALVSTHGRKTNLTAAVRENEKVFALVSGAKGMREICRELMDNGLSDVRLWIGQDLSYPDEKIVEGTPEELLSENFSSLLVVLAVNPRAGDHLVTHGIPDACFIRGEVPMTKEEIREIALSKLHLTRNSVLYDVGAGTGSVSVEAARMAVEGKVFAVEKKPEAVELIGQNARKFGVTNLIVTQGTAPEALADLPAPTHTFIGGSGGRLSAVLDAVRMKNPDTRFVVTAVSLETEAALTAYLQQHPPLHRDLVRVSCAKEKEAGRSHIMTAQNPVLTAAFDYRGDRL